MGFDTPSGAPPVDKDRIDKGVQAKDGSFEANTFSHYDPANPNKKTVPIDKAIGSFTADVQATSAVTAKLFPETKRVRVEAGWTTMIADAKLRDDVDPAQPNFRIGWVQTLVSSRRIGVYRTKAGNTFQKVMPLGTASDRRQYDIDNTKADFDADPEAQKGGSKLNNIAAPWYDLPEVFGVAPEHRKIHIHAFDKPAFSMDSTYKSTANDKDPLNGAQLVSIAGGESFMTSLKAGDQGEVTLKTWHWEVPWDMNVEGITEAGKEGKKGTSGVEPDKDKNKNVDGKTALQQAKSNDYKTFITCDTEAAAKERLAGSDYDTFVREMLAQRDAIKTVKEVEQSYWNMVAALWASPKQMRVQILDDKNAPLTPKELSKLHLTFAADGTFTANQDGNTYTMLAHMVLDPNGTMTKELTITLAGAKAMTVKSPYSANVGEPFKVTIPGWMDDEKTVKVRFSIS